MGRLVLYVILILAFVTRLINLNYNSAFNDEAIYIVIGRLGIFSWDWTTYNPSSWMGGLPYIYPSIAAIAHVTGGLLGARLLNVIFGLLTIEAIFLITYLATPKNSNGTLAGIIAAGIVAFDPVSHYVSRLATYDMPCFYFLFLSLALLLFGTKSKTRAPMFYFTAFLSLALSFSIKIISGIYIPLIIIYFYYFTKKLTSYNHLTWKKYFVFPLMVFIALFIISQFQGLLPYFSTQIGREKANMWQIITEFLNNTRFIWPFWLFSLGGFALSKKWTTFLVLNAASFALLAFHIVTSREPGIDKHVFLNIGFFAIQIGLGISYLFAYLARSTTKSFLLGCSVGLIFFAWMLTYPSLTHYNTLWRNTDSVHNYLAGKMNRDDKILTELGAGTMLNTYDKTKPTNIITFDWFEYRSLIGNEAYSSAVADGLFNYIVLESQSAPKSNVNKNLHDIVSQNLGQHYGQVYNQNGFFVYKRNY